MSQVTVLKLNRLKKWCGLNYCKTAIREERDIFSLKSLSDPSAVHYQSCSGNERGIF